MYPTSPHPHSRGLSFFRTEPTLYLGEGASEEIIMCDYSLFAVPNRLATEHEDLATYRFATGSIGLASPADLRESAHPDRASFWSRIRQWFFPAVSRPVRAVCVPPGARLKLRGVPATLRDTYGLQEGEEVTFTQLTASSYAYRDAIRFPNGRQVLLQELPEGLAFRVVSLALADPEWEPFREEIHARLR
jgi:hypothetical protein